MEIEDKIFLFHNLEDRVIALIGFNSTIRVGRDASRVRFDAWKAGSYRKFTKGSKAGTNRQCRPSLLS